MPSKTSIICFLEQPSGVLIFQIFMVTFYFNLFQASPVKRIPEFISKQIQPVVFQLLFNSQLTIREHAAKTLATYITCSSINVSFMFPSIDVFMNLGTVVVCLLELHMYLKDGY